MIQHSVIEPAESDAAALASRLGSLVGGTVYPRSPVVAEGVLYALVRIGVERRLLVASEQPEQSFEGAHQAVSLDGREVHLVLGACSASNMQLLRSRLPWLVATVLGRVPSVGCGDRLGVATPGHLRAARKYRVAPILAQQSIREMTRIGRRPQEVMDDACWGVFQEGWQHGFGADADHLKTTADIDVTLAAGFTFFTIDPSAYVDDAVDLRTPEDLLARYDVLPWEQLLSSPSELHDIYTARPFDAGSVRIRFDESTFLRAAVKYAAAVAHTAALYRYLLKQAGTRPFELEISVDETDAPTSVQEHLFVASELRRLGVQWVSLAPRFVGRMEKGVEYIGDLEEFARALAGHVAIARSLGPYKISLHSGSDKFALYPLFAERAGDLFHLKTAGTSYLEALRAAAGIDVHLFREIYAYARGRYEEDRASYHVSALLDRTPEPDAIPADHLPALLDDHHVRQVLHVTYGSVLTVREPDGSFRFRDRLLSVLRDREEHVYQVIEHHFDRHLESFGAR